MPPPSAGGITIDLGPINSLNQLGPALQQALSSAMGGQGAAAAPPPASGGSAGAVGRGSGAGGRGARSGANAGSAQPAGTAGAQAAAPAGGGSAARQAPSAAVRRPVSLCPRAMHAPACFSQPARSPRGPRCCLSLRPQAREAGATEEAEEDDEGQGGAGGDRGGSGGGMMEMLQVLQPVMSVMVEQARSTVQREVAAALQRTAPPSAVAQVAAIAANVASQVRRGGLLYRLAPPRPETRRLRFSPASPPPRFVSAGTWRVATMCRPAPP